jgi:hypothetical protein
VTDEYRPIVMLSDNDFPAPVKTFFTASHQLRPGDFIFLNNNPFTQSMKNPSLFSQISAVFDAFIDASYDIVFLS